MEKSKYLEILPRNIAILLPIISLLIASGCSSSQNEEVLLVIQACFDANNNQACEPDEVPVQGLIVERTLHELANVRIAEAYQTDSEGQIFIGSHSGEQVKLLIPENQTLVINKTQKYNCSAGFVEPKYNSGMVIQDIPFNADTCHGLPGLQSRNSRNKYLTHVPYNVQIKTARQNY